MVSKQYIKKLNKAYKKNFKRKYNEIFYNLDAGLQCFVLYITYLRDHMLLTSAPEDSLTSCTTAIAEFNAFVNAANDEKRLFHWNNFFELVKQNMEEWLIPNDSI